MSLSLYRAKSPLLGQHGNNTISVVQDSQSDQFGNAESPSSIISFNGLLDDHYLWKINPKCLKLKLLNWNIWEALLEDFLCWPRPVLLLLEMVKESKQEEQVLMAEYVRVRCLQCAVIPVSFAGVFSSWFTLWEERSSKMCYLPVIFVFWVLLSLLRPLVIVFGETWEYNDKEGFILWSCLSAPQNSNFSVRCLSYLF